ncbi:MAG: hypothetical protein IJX19_05120 [Clostridia bacterium]|nr:hypothetical protein [Clostridia bacterium]
MMSIMTVHPTIVTTRHPHVFGRVEADTTAQVLQNWDAIKTEEKQRLSLGDKLRAIPPMLPSLMRAAKVSKKASLTREETAQSLRDKLIRQASALTPASSDAAENSARMGEILLTVTQLCEKLQVDAEESLQHTIDDVIEKVASVS